MGKTRKIVRRTTHASTPSHMAEATHRNQIGKTNTPRQSQKAWVQSQTRLRNRSSSGAKRWIAKAKAQIWTKTQTHGSPQVQASKKLETHRRRTNGKEIPENG